MQSERAGTEGRRSSTESAKRWQWRHKNEMSSLLQMPLADAQEPIAVLNRRPSSHECPCACHRQETISYRRTSHDTAPQTVVRSREDTSRDSLEHAQPRRPTRHSRTDFSCNHRIDSLDDVTRSLQSLSCLPVEQSEPKAAHSVTELLETSNKSDETMKLENVRCGVDDRTTPVPTPPPPPPPLPPRLSRLQSEPGLPTAIDSTQQQTLGSRKNGNAHELGQTSLIEELQEHKKNKRVLVCENRRRHNNSIKDHENLHDVQQSTSNAARDEYQGNKEQETIDVQECRRPRKNRTQDLPETSSPVEAELEHVENKEVAKTTCQEYHRRHQHYGSEMKTHPLADERKRRFYELLYWFENALHLHNDSLSRVTSDEICSIGADKFEEIKQHYEKYPIEAEGLEQLKDYCESYHVRRRQKERPSASHEHHYTDASTSTQSELSEESTATNSSLSSDEIDRMRRYYRRQRRWWKKTRSGHASRHYSPSAERPRTAGSRRHHTSHSRGKRRSEDGRRHRHQRQRTHSPNNRNWSRRKRKE